MMERNPELGQMLTNPAVLRQAMETMRNPVGHSWVWWDGLLFPPYLSRHNHELGEGDA